MQEKRRIGCSFCGQLVNSKHSALICPSCLKTAPFEFCPGCGLNIAETEKEAATEKVHMRTWHSECRAAFTCAGVSHVAAKGEVGISSKKTLTRQFNANSTFLYHQPRVDEGIPESLIGKGEFERKSPSGDLASSPPLSPSHTPYDMQKDDASGEPLIPRMIKMFRSVGIVKERAVKGQKSREMLIGSEMTGCLLDQKVVETMAEAKKLCQSMVDARVITPLDDSFNEAMNDSFNESEEFVFHGGQEEYYVDSAMVNRLEVTGTTSGGETKRAERERFVHHSGYLMYNDMLTGLTQKRWFELCAGVLVSYLEPDTPILDEYIINEYKIGPMDLPGEKYKLMFKMEGAAGSSQFIADSEQSRDDWLHALLNAK